MQLPHYAQAVLLIVRPGGGVLLVAGRKLRHLEGGVDVLEALAQHVERAPQLRRFLLDGWALHVQLLRQPFDEYRLGVPGVVLGELLPRLWLGVLHPGNRILGVERRAAVIALVVGIAFLQRQWPIHQPPLGLQRCANFVFKLGFGVDGCHGCPSRIFLNQIGLWRLSINRKQLSFLHYLERRCAPAPHPRWWPRAVLSGA